MDTVQELRAEIDKLNKVIAKQQRAYAALEERLTELEKPKEVWRPLTVKRLGNTFEQKAQ